jgi:2,3-bisphosphoglycerate-dependent phosphoglycerate mutase
LLELWLVRHGETDWNVQGRVQGWTDVPLNELGVLQAELLSLWMEGIPFRALVMSDLIRARHTATILQSRIKAPIMTDPLLRERSFGKGEGMLRSDMLRLYPTGAPEAETAAEVEARAVEFLSKMTKTYSDGRILCVSHGGMIRAILKVLGFEPPPHLGNTSVSRIRFHDGKWDVLAVNWSEHLTPSSAYGEHPPDRDGDNTAVTKVSTT